MEAVAAAASIAGIITVVGQSIDGLIKFSEFFSDISSASKTISRLLNDINSLIQVLENIGDVLERAQARRRGQNFASLDIKLEDCAKDVQIWLATARLLRPGSDSGGKAWLRKFRLAVNNTAIQTIREEIGRHRQTLCLSLAVFGRTIDIDTSNQVHQIGGRFDEALSTSLSIHGAHVEALRRIEHYSMTSMHSSAHSIRSMDSIRTELTRLEAMITSTSVASLSEVETGNNHTRRGSSCTENRSSAVEEGGNRGPNLLNSGPSPELSGEISIARDSATAHAPRRTSSTGSRKHSSSSSQSKGKRETSVEYGIQPDYHIPSAEYRSFLDEPDDTNNQYMKNPSEEGNKSSFLYAEFAKTSQTRQPESSENEVDHGAIHRILRQSLASIYPPEVVEYVSLWQVTTLCEDHIHLLDKRPSIQMSATGKVKEIPYVDDGTSASAQPSMISLRDRLIELRNAIKLSREHCIQAGHSLSELDKLLSPPGSGSFASADQPPPKLENNSGDDSSSIYSEDFHSSAE
ncbi:hypothetical protein HO133_000110 [Letharia lupina]|uniref:Fungal N-terminal domain-containing protein n=1 Tax=Letharia lupina TaxID=560253 RepID=A0A8H6CH29_9LECA|nr:uncharacterized protein HO133_000110 [Letharia lupina]KAF6223268.1 hypothetical protein HO133_000110 [Letharia lupina]